jgi:hypothetical protein
MVSSSGQQHQWSAGSSNGQRSTTSMVSGQQQWSKVNNINGQQQWSKVNNINGQRAAASPSFPGGSAARTGSPPKGLVPIQVDFIEFIQDLKWEMMTGSTVLFIYDVRDPRFSSDPLHGSLRFRYLDFAVLGLNRNLSRRDFLCDGGSSYFL